MPSQTFVPYEPRPRVVMWRGKPAPRWLAWLLSGWLDNLVLWLRRRG